ncbi:DUF1707 SHOCT-like domain-containing protein [Corynebacterium sp. H113]|uniref:DUF1707 SHOCT-like domain-containing protein n=1 Tax=Corynebacterium sp. H113 TaxID=3133419 RepID=UPI0030AC70C5
MDTPPLRASDVQRRRVAEELAHALERGQLTLTEFEERTDKVWKTTLTKDLGTVLEDLVPDPLRILDQEPSQYPYPVARQDDAIEGRSTSMDPYTNRDLAAVAKAHVTNEPGGSSLSVAIMFGSEQAGDWIIDPRHTAVAIMGGISLDLRRARLSSAHTEIFAVAIMGGIEVIVPEDIRLRVTGQGIMGGFGSTTANTVTIAGHELPPDAPEVIIRGVAIMGGVEVTRVPRRKLES